MTTEIANSAPAGAENTAAPAGSMPEILSIDDAAQRWMDNEEAETQQEAPASQPPATNTAETEQVATDAAAAGQTGEPERVEAEATTAEPSPLDFETLPGTAKLRLRDGTEVTVADLKKDWDSLRQVGQVKQQIAAQAHELQQRMAQSAQKEQFFAQVVPLAIANAQAAIPPEPEPPVFDPSDPMGFLEKQAKFQADVSQRNKKIGELRQLQAAQAHQAQEQQQHQQHQTKEYIAEQRKALFSALPRLRDDKAREAFHTDYVQLATSLGFEAHEYSQAVDHRVMLMADLAMDGLKYRKLKAEPPKPKPAAPQAQTPPVAEPGRRQTTAEAAGAKRQELLDRARRTGGSVNDIARLVAELE